MMHTAYIGIGGNIGHPIRIFKACVSKLRITPGIFNLQCSPLYRSGALGYEQQPDFINGVLELDTTLSPPSLLSLLQTLEHQFGRERSFPNAPRTLDLDLLLYGNECFIEDHLMLPHPRLTERAFVLLPLMDLNPHLQLPNGQVISECISHCADQRIERFDSPRWCAPEDEIF